MDVDQAAEPVRAEHGAGSGRRAQEAAIGTDGGLDGTDGSAVMTLHEVSSLLRLSEATVLRLVESGELPGRRFGRQWRFSRHAVMASLEGPGDRQ